MINFADLLEKTKKGMSGDKYRVSLQVQLPGGPIADLTASRAYFSWKGLAIVSQHLIIAQIENAKIDDMERLFYAGFRLGKQINRVPLLRSMQFGYMIIPVIATSNPDKALLEYAVSRPRKHWALFEFPVVLDLQSGETHCYRKTAFWGAFFFSDMRKVVSRYIEGAVT